GVGGRRRPLRCRRLGQRSRGGGGGAGPGGGVGGGGRRRRGRRHGHRGVGGRLVVLVVVEDVVDLVADGVLDLAQLPEPTTHLTADLGKTLRAEDQQRHDEDDEDLGRAELGHPDSLRARGGRAAYRCVGSDPGSVRRSRRAARRSRSVRTVATRGTSARSARSKDRNRAVISRRSRVESIRMATAPTVTMTARSDTIVAFMAPTLPRSGGGGAS